MQPRISMITLGVHDLAVAIEFYEKGLGFPRMESPPEVAFFTLNGTWLGLYGRDALAKDEIQSRIAALVQGRSRYHVGGQRRIFTAKYRSAPPHG